MLNDIKAEASQRMQKCIQSFQMDLKKLRTGRAHPSLIEGLKVDAYGSDTPLSQLANIAVEEGRTLVVTPWDRTMVGPIEKAIHKSDLHLTPNTAGTVIRIPLPPLTEERRRDILKVVRGDAENAKVSVRNVRRDAIAGREGSAEGKDDLAGRRAAWRGRDPEADRQGRGRHRPAAGGQGKRNPAGLTRTPAWRHRVTSRSSWTATAAGRRRAGCRARPATRKASNRCACASANA